MELAWFADRAPDIWTPAGLADGSVPSTPTTRDLRDALADLDRLLS